MSFPCLDSFRAVFSSPSSNHLLSALHSPIDCGPSNAKYLGYFRTNMLAGSLSNGDARLSAGHSRLELAFERALNLNSRIDPT